MNTNAEIKFFLQKKGASSVLEISKALDLTKADIRYHLTHLVDSNEVCELLPVRNSKTRGRPASKFVLESNPTAKNLAFLVNLIIEQVNHSHPPRRIAQSMLSKFVNHDDQLNPSFSNMNDVIDLLNNLGIIASWSAGKNGPQISITNNPYKNIDPQPYAQVVDQLIQLLKEYVTSS